MATDRLRDMYIDVPVPLAPYSQAQTLSITLSVPKKMPLKIGVTVFPTNICVQSANWRQLHNFIDDSPSSRLLRVGGQSSFSLCVIFSRWGRKELGWLTTSACTPLSSKLSKTARWPSLFTASDAELIKLTLGRPRHNPLAARWVQLNLYFSKLVSVTRGQWLGLPSTPFWPQLVCRALVRGPYKKRT